MPKSPHMIIHKGVWHFRLFQWSLKIIDTWKGGNGRYEDKFEYGTSLFHYLRVICLYMPFALLSNVLMYSWVAFTLLILPMQIGDHLEYAAFWFILCVVFVWFVILRALIFWWAGYEGSDFWRTVFSIVLTGKKPGPRAPHAPGFVMIIRKWIRSKRVKVRPMITFVEREK